MHADEFNRNRNKFPPEELEKHEGRYVAWNQDGTAIIAAADDWESLFAAVDASPYDPSECVLSWIGEADDLVFGSLWIETDEQSEVAP